MSSLNLKLVCILCSLFLRDTVPLRTFLNAGINSHSLISPLQRYNQLLSESINGKKFGDNFFSVSMTEEDDNEVEKRRRPKKNTKFDRALDDFIGKR